MSDLEAKQKYYDYNPAEGGSWWLKTPPDEPEWFQKELNDLAGFHERMPRLRVVWGGTAMNDITEKKQLKYLAVTEMIDGYNYLKQDGTIGVTRSMNLPSDAVVPWQFHPRFRRIEMGRLRWAIQRHVPAEELRRLGRFQNRRSPTGEIILRELPPEGVYDHFFWVETKGGKYRDLDREVMTAIQAMYLYDINTTEAQKALDADEMLQKQKLVSEGEVREVWEDLLDRSGRT